ncbi:MAG: hypothetical protein GF331_27300 [Chitinivibrionales bacterium]|nr:hypothetical protein [Chitinivibrionales bacterium]
MTTSKSTYHGVFQSLPPGTVRAAGWLHDWLCKQARQLGKHLPRVSDPFTGAYWAGEETLSPTLLTGQEWWPWEQKGYWLDGVLRLGLILGDKALLDEAAQAVHYTLTHAGADGYLGPTRLADPAGDQYRWPHAVFFRAMMAYAEAHDDATIPAAMQAHFLGDTTDYADNRNVTNIEAMLWAYEKTGDTRLVELAERSWQGYLQKGSENEGDLTAARVDAGVPIQCHGVTYAEMSKLPAVLYMYTGKRSYLEYALKAQERVFTHHMLVDGMASTSEHFESITERQVHETCDIADFT